MREPQAPAPPPSTPPRAGAAADTAPPVAPETGALPPELGARLDAWRARNATAADPLRHAFVEALARRVRGRTGAVRERLEARLAQLLAAADPQPVAAPPSTPAPAMPGEPGALALLVSAFARTRPLPPSADGPSTVDDALQSLGGPPDLKAMGYFRSTWTRLSAERRLTQSLARVPAKAGPLNAQHLVHQTLAALHALSPGYLERFLDYADTLMWLERAQTPAAVPAGRAEGARSGETAKRGAVAKRGTRPPASSPGTGKTEPVRKSAR